MQRGKHPARRRGPVAAHPALLDTVLFALALRAGLSVAVVRLPLGPDSVLLVQGARPSDVRTLNGIYGFCDVDEGSRSRDLCVCLGLARCQV